MKLLIIENVQNNLVTSSDISLIDESNNIVISDTSVHPQIKISESPFTCVVGEILEWDRASYPYTPHPIEQALRESRRVLTRVYSQKTSIPHIDFGLPHQNRNSTSSSVVEQSPLETQVLELGIPSFQLIPFIKMGYRK